MHQDEHIFGIRLKIVSQQKKNTEKLSATAFAQNVDSGKGGAATITVSNASKGETYKIHKLFDATVTGTKDGSIAYTGTVPTSLDAYFAVDAKGNITVKDAAYEDPTAKTGMSEGLRTALKTWAGTAPATAEAVSDGSVLQFKNLPYGYYIVTTTQGESAITVTSTNPDAEIVDKNSSVPKDLTKTADKESVNIGDTVTYTVSFKTSNYDGAGTAAKLITSYVIEDTLPDFLKDVTVTSIIIDEDSNPATTLDNHNVTTPFVSKKIELEWVNVDGTSLYKNGSTVTITYTATVNDKVAIDGAGNKNDVKISWVTAGSTVPETGKEITTSETIYTYAIAIKKVNENGEALLGAEFELPFYVKETPDTTDNAYIYAGTVGGTGLTNKVTTPADGLIIIKGVKEDTYSITETVAPSGYNLLTAPFDVTAVKTGGTTTSSTTYLDEHGNILSSGTSTTKVDVELTDISAAVKVVVNKSGAVLPSTGGMGTRLFYILGGLLVTGAVILLVSKKRMGSSEE